MQRSVEERKGAVNRIRGEKKTKYPDNLKSGKRVYIDFRLNFKKKTERKWRKKVG